jgi:hypothetical protein
MLPLTDIGVKIKIEKEYTDGDHIYNKSDRDFNSLVREEALSGIYMVNIILAYDEDLDDETLLYSFNLENAKTFKIAMDTLLQISRRVDKIEWDIRDNNIELAIFCPKKKYDNVQKDKIVSERNAQQIKNYIEKYVSIILRSTAEHVTDSFKRAGIDMPFIINAQHEKTMSTGHLYLYFGAVTKSSLTVNRRKSERLIEDVETFREKNIPNVTIPIRAKYVMTIDFDYSEVLKKAKEIAER